MSSRSARRAARALNLSPSTLSRHMAALEQELGVQLLDHGNKTEFTPAAYAVMPAIVNVLRAYDAVFDAIPRKNDAKSHPFRVYCVDHDQLCEEILSFALEELRRDRDIRIVEVTDMGDSLRDSLLDGEADAVFGLPINDEGGRLEHHEVLQDRLMVWFGTDSDLVGAIKDDGTIPLSALSGHVLPITIDPRMRRGHDSVTEALLGANLGIRTEPVFIGAYREYYSHITGNRFCVAGTTNTPSIPLALRDRFESAVIDGGEANANRVLTMRSGERGVAAIRLLAALRKAAANFGVESV